MLVRVADFGKKVLYPVSRILRDIAMVALAFAILLVVIDVCSRRLFDSPIDGTHDFTNIAFSMIVFLPLAWCAFENGHVELDLITKRLPKILQSILEVIMIFAGSVILGIMSWQMFVQGMNLQAKGLTTGIVEIPYHPFLYAASIASAVLTLAFFIRFLYSISALRGGRQ